MVVNVFAVTSDGCQFSEVVCDNLISVILETHITKIITNTTLINIKLNFIYIAQKLYQCTFHKEV